MQTPTKFRIPAGEPMQEMSLRMVLAPLFVALSIITGFLQFVLNSEALMGPNLIFLGLGLWFGFETRRCQSGP
jgi:hypothetical protein